MNPVQFRKLDVAPLAREGERIRSALLLRHAADQVVVCVVQLDLAASLDGQAPLVRKVGIPHTVLGTACGRRMKASGPPFGSPGPRSGARRSERCWMLGEPDREVIAQRADACCQLSIEHVADHQHAAAHPLAVTAKFGMAELCHGAVAYHQ